MTDLYVWLRLKFHLLTCVLNNLILRSVIYLLYEIIFLGHKSFQNDILNVFEEGHVREGIYCTCEC